MVDRLYREILDLEKSLPESLVKMKYRSLSVWSIVRMPIFNQLADRLQKKSGMVKVPPTGTTWRRKFQSVKEEASIFFAFLHGFARAHDTRVLIRVNSFSILGESDGRVLFKNKNLQQIVDGLFRDRVKCLIVVSDLEGYKLKKKLNAALLYPTKLSFFVRYAFCLFNKSWVNHATQLFQEYLPLEKKVLQKTVLNQLAIFAIWNFIFKYIKPSAIYYESPHASFEPEIAAAKKNNIKTIEIYHGTVNSEEPSYFQKHLDFDKMIHAVCDEFLSPTKNQTKFLNDINGKYKKIKTLRYKSNISLSIKEKLKFVKRKNRPIGNRKRILFITSISDGAINEVKNYIKKNRIYLLENFKEISIRLHPEDFVARWKIIGRLFPFVEFSRLPLIDDVISTDVVIGLNTTVLLQLKSMKIDFINISKERI